MNYSEHYDRIFADLKEGNSMQDRETFRYSCDEYVEAGDWLNDLYMEELEQEAQKYKDTGDAVFAIAEQLYNSANAIDEGTVDGAFLYLCKEYGIDTDLIRDGLCVIHYKCKCGRL